MLSTPDVLEQAILQGIAELGLAKAVSTAGISIILESTVETNGAIE